jgi:hypothetical protein
LKAQVRPDGANVSVQQPQPFLTVRVHDFHSAPTLCGLCVGYENKVWRSKQFADHVVEWIPEFALTPSEWLAMRHFDSVPKVRRAVKAVYESQKFEKRGEFGELFLHIAIRQVHNSLPAISKIYYKSARNDTVKGFDAVHVVGTPDDLELWLGEAKFYEDIDAAIRDVIEELGNHLATDYLRDEFLLITGKIDDSWPHAATLKKLLSPNMSLDEVFSRACVPVLLTYDSDCLTRYNKCTDEYKAEFKIEVTKHYRSFVQRLKGKRIPAEVRIHLFLLPLHTKKVLIQELDEKLKIWQQL